MNRRPRPERKVYRVQAVERALDILDCFDFHYRELSLTEICRRTKLNKSTAQRLTSNLLARNYLNLDSTTGLYSLGMKLFELGSVVFSSFSLRKSASRYMTQLQHETSSTVLLGVLMDQQLVYVDKRDGEGTVRISSEIGWRRPPHFGMLGMILMAGLSETAVDALLQKYPLVQTTKSTIADPVAFKERLAHIAENGYIVEYGEAVDGVIGIAAPVTDYSRKVVAAVGVAILAAQHDRVSVKRITTSVCSAAKGISSELGYMKS